MNTNLTFAPKGEHFVFPVKAVVFGPHQGFAKPGQYCVHIQSGRDISMMDGGVFDFKSIMRPAVMDDFGTLVGVKS